MEISFCKLKSKDVVNVCDGRNLGSITDIIFDSCCGQIIGIIVPNSKNFFNIFKSNNDIFIPYNRICKIGKDIILVDIIMQQDCINQSSQNCCTQELKQNNKQKININTILTDINNQK